MSTVYPLKFRPIYKDYVWGGSRIITHFKRPAADVARVAESWEISARAEGMSLVADGPLAGKSLRELVTQFGAELLGRGMKDRKFPLLIKLIDARETLSVQVHPDDISAARSGGEAKSEMWYVLQADPGAFVYCGFARDVQPAEFTEALRDKTLADLLRKIPVRAGDTVYVPGGSVHAIGAGCLLLEIQQSSNTTYRIHDWDRPGPDGQPRALHVEEALRVIRWGRTQPVGPDQSPYFRFETFAVRGRSEERLDGGSFHALFVESGNVKIDGSECAAGTSILLPAALKDVTIEGDGRLCRIRVP